jgi:hypothetical protein
MHPRRGLIELDQLPLVRGKRDVVDFHDPAAVVSRGAPDGIDALLDVQP